MLLVDDAISYSLLYPCYTEYIVIAITVLTTDNGNNKANNDNTNSNSDTLQ